MSNENGAIHSSSGINGLNGISGNTRESGDSGNMAGAAPKTDRRVRKTKRAVHAALLQLMTEKKLSQITVKELTEQADINRKTFYNHYDDIFAVLDEVENECVDRMLALFDLNNFDRYIEKPDLFFSSMLSEISNNREFYTLLNQSADHSHILNKLIRKEKALLRKLFNPEQMDEIWIDYFLNYASAGTISVIQIWFESQHDVPVDSLARFFSSLFTASDLKRYLSYAQDAGRGADV